MPITVTSWNMQGAQGYADPVGQSKKRKALEGSNISDALNLLAHGTDVLALQEVGGAPADWNLGAGASNGVALATGYIQVGTTRRQRHVSCRGSASPTRRSPPRTPAQPPDHGKMRGLGGGAR